MSRLFEIKNVKIISILLFIGILLFAISSHSAVSASDDLVLWMKFNNGPGESSTFFRDSSSFGNNGVCDYYDCPAILSTGKFGNSYHSNGYKFINISSSNSLIFDDNSDISISVWIKPDPYRLSRDYNTVLAKGRTADDELANYVLRTVENNTEFYYLDINGEWQVFRTTSNMLLDGEWQQIVLVYTFGQPESAKFYANNVLQSAYWDQGTGAIPPQTNNDPLLIGAINPLEGSNGAEFFVGGIDNLLIFNKILSPQEITDLYNFESPPSINITNSSINTTINTTINTSINGSSNVSFNTSSIINGWNSISGTWKKTVNNTIIINTSNSTLHNSRTLSIRAGTNYILSRKILNPTNCNANVILHGDCVDTDWNRRNCFNDVVIDSINSQSWNSSYAIFNIPTSQYTHGDGYYKDLILSLEVDTGNNGNTNCDVNMAMSGIQFDDISLKELKDQNAWLDINPQITNPSGCCPKAWCWDGDTCVNSLEYMSDSQKDPLWNYALNYTINNWTNNHVLLNYSYKTNGYRCVVNNLGEANWTLSRIKYDWNNAESGYCNYDSECFVGTEYSNPTNFNSSCIKNGESIGIVNDGPGSSNYILNGGNNYCHDGNWTTKSYIIATTLQNLTNGRDFTLFCDDVVKNVFNNQILQQHIVAACTISIVHSSSEQIITGFVLDDASYNATLFEGLRGVYFGSFIDPTSSTTANQLDIADSLAECEQENGDYSSCTNVGLGETVDHMYIYYNNRSQFFLLSNEQITNIQPTFWSAISGFFSRLFGVTQPEYEYIKYVSNYDRVYIMKSDDTNAKGIEESKYDESNGTIKTFLYLNYSGINNSNNPINLKIINSTGRVLITTYTNTSTTQELIIKSSGRTGLWEYMTAVLRHRE